MVNAESPIRIEKNVNWPCVASELFIFLEVFLVVHLKKKLSHCTGYSIFGIDYNYICFDVSSVLHSSTKRTSYCYSSVFSWRKQDCWAVRPSSSVHRESLHCGPPAHYLAVSCRGTLKTKVPVKKLLHVGIFLSLFPAVKQMLFLKFNIHFNYILKGTFPCVKLNYRIMRTFATGDF